MTTPISTTPTLNLNLSAVNAPLAEVNRSENPTEKPLSPETQEALERWYKKKDDAYGLYPQANQSKLSDFLQHPVKNLTNAITLVGTLIMGFMGAFALDMAHKTKNFSTEQLKDLGYASHKEFKYTSYISAVGTLLVGGLGLWQASRIKNINKDTLQGIQTLGDQATRQEWLDYKKTHPTIANA
jgi:preprotein translocase subunit Sss1